MTTNLTLPRFARRQEWVVLFVALALMATAAALFLWFRPSHMVVAVGPEDTPETRLMQAYAEGLKQEDKNVSLRVAPYADLRLSGEALAQKKAQLAVVRPDAYLPENGLTVAILRQEAVILAAPEASKITEIAELAGKRLGVVARHEADPAFVDHLLARYDLAAPQVTVVPLRLDGVEAAFGAKSVDAVVMLATPTGEAAATLLQAVERKAPKGKVTLIPVTEGEALALKDPTLTAMTIPAGALRGRPKLPAEDVKTVGVSYRLMARTDADRDRVSLVTEYLFGMRSRLARATPAAYQLRPPEFDSAITATSALLPNHPGAVDYLQREQQTFFQRYGDWIYLLMFSGGGIGSALAWLAQRFARKRRELVDKILDRLMDILTEARSCKSVTELDALAAEIDSLVIHSVRYARRSNAGSRAMHTIILAIDSARAAIADQRRQVIDQAAEDEAGATGRAPRLVLSS